MPLESFGPYGNEERPAPAFALSSGEGKPVRLWDYKQRKSLVIYFLQGKETEFLKQLQNEAEAYRANGAALLVITPLDQVEAGQRAKETGRDDRNLERYLDLFGQENIPLLFMGGALFLSSFLYPWKSSFLTKLAAIPLSAWYLFFTLPLLLGLGVIGTDHNHFLPAEAAGCAAAGVLVAKSFSFFQDGRLRWLALLPVLGFLAQAAIFSVPAPRYEIEFRPRPADYQRQLGKIVQFAASQPGPILTGEAAFLVMANRPAGPYFYNDLFTLSALARRGLYADSGLLEAVRQKKFSLVLAEGNFFREGEIRPDVWSPELVEAIKQNYKVLFRDVWFVYDPRP